MSPLNSALTTRRPADITHATAVNGRYDSRVTG